MSVRGVKAMVFDVFGTVVDWRTSVIREARAMGDAHGIVRDWEAFTDDWKSAYHPGMERVRTGQDPWTDVDTINRRKLDALLAEYDIPGLSEDEKVHLNQAWWRLDGWPDSVAGLTRLKKKYIIGTLSNGTFACLVNMGKHAGLPWDCVLTADNARAYKPDPATYRMAIELLYLQPHEVMLVAAHNYDLEAAAGEGMATGFFPRPGEYGPGQTANLEATGNWDVVACDLADFAGKMGL